MYYFQHFIYCGSDKVNKMYSGCDLIPCNEPSLIINHLGDYMGDYDPSFIPKYHLIKEAECWSAFLTLNSVGCG